MASRSQNGRPSRSIFVMSWLSILLINFSVSTIPVYAQEAPEAVPNGAAIDLSSTEATMAASNNNPVMVSVGGALQSNGVITGAVNQTFNPGQMVTPAQFMAISQVMSGASQTLVLTAAGAAAGGFASVSPATMSALSSLNIPTGVSLNSIGFNAATAFNVQGLAAVNGALYALQQSQTAVAVMNLGSLMVGPNGLVTTNLPPYASMLNNVVASSGLAMNIAGTLHNYGTISTAGPLSVMAGGAIYNQTMAGMSQASMIAQSVTMSSLASTIVNSGIITALNGNITMASNLASHLSVLNTDGVLSAINGMVNFRGADFTGKYNLNVTGGDILSHELNLYSGDGIVNVYANNITGRVNVTAGEAHISAQTDNLTLGNMTLSGDPSFYNMQPNGDVTIAGNLVFHGQDLAIVASRDVVTAAGAGQIDTSSATGKGGSVTIVAGAQFTSSIFPSGPVPPPTVPPSGIVNSSTVTNPDANNPNLQLTITGPSATGGKIDLATTGALTLFTTASTGTLTSGNPVGGNVTLIAFDGTSSPATDAGTIKLPQNLTIATGGGAVNPGAGPANFYPSGNVVVIAGPTSASTAGVQLGSIDTRNSVQSGASSVAAGGAVSINVAQPMLAGGNPVVIRGGTVMSGAFVPDTNAYKSAVVAVNQVTATGAVQIISGGNITLLGTLRTLPNTLVSQPTNILLAAGVNGLPNPATIRISDIFTGGNSLSMVSNFMIRSIEGAVATTVDTTSPASVNGSLTMLLGADTVVTPLSTGPIPQLVQVTYSQPSASNGAVSLQAPATIRTGIATNPNPGGAVNILSFTGSVGMTPNSTILTRGGAVTVIAGMNSGQHLPNCTICLGSIDTSGGTGPGDVFVATEDPTFTGPVTLGATYAGLPLNNIVHANAVPVNTSSINFGGSISALGTVKVLAGLDIGFPSVSSVTTGGTSLILAAGINQDPGTVLPSAYNPVYAGSLVLGVGGTGKSVALTGPAGQVQLVSGTNLTVPGLVDNPSGGLFVVVNGNLLALPTNAGTLKIESTGSVFVTATAANVILSGGSAGTTFTINATLSTSSITQQVSTSVSANTLDLSAGSGGINNINTNAGTLKFNTSGNVTWTDNNTAVNFDNTTVGGTMTGFANNSASQIGQLASTQLTVNTLDLHAGTSGIALPNISVNTLKLQTTASASWTNINANINLSDTNVGGSLTGHATHASSAIGQVAGSGVTATNLDLTAGSGGILLTNLNISDIKLSTSANATVTINSPALALNDSTVGGTLKVIMPASTSAITQSGSQLSAATLDLSAGTGGIQLTDTSVSNLKFVTSGDVGITNTDALTVGNGSSAHSAIINNTDGITVTGNMTTSTSLELNSNQGSITGLGSLISPEVALSAQTGNINVTTQTGSLDLDASGTMTVNNSGNTVVVYVLNTNGTSLNVNNNNNIQTQADIVVVSSISFTVTSGNGGIALGGGLTADDQITLSANGTGNISQSQGFLTSDSISLSTGTGVIGPSAGIVTVASAVDFSTQGAVTIHNSGPKLTIGQSSGSVVQITNDNDISAGSITATSSIALTTNPSSDAEICVAGTLSAPSVVLSADGSGKIAGPGQVNASQVTATSQSGDITLKTQTPLLNTNTSGNLNLTNSVNPLTLTIASAVPNSLTVTNSNSITTSGIINISTDASLTTTSNNGDLLFGNDFNVGSNSTLTLQTNGSGTIRQTTGTVSGFTLNFTTGGGNVLLSTSFDYLSGSSGANGYTNVTNSGKDLNLGPVSGQSIQVSNNMDLYVAGAVYSPNSVTLTTTANGGNIILDAPVGDNGQLVAVVAMTADGGIMNGLIQPLISGRDVTLVSNGTVAVIGTPGSHLQVNGRTLSATPIPPGATNVDFNGGPQPPGPGPNPTPGPIPEVVTEEEDASVISDIISQDSSSNNSSNSFVDRDGSPTVTPTDATPQSHEVPVDLNAGNVHVPNVDHNSTDQTKTDIQAFSSDHGLNSNSLHQMHNEGINIQAGNNDQHFILNQGNILIQPNNPLTITVKEGDVHVPSGAHVFITETGNDSAIYELSEGKGGPVRVKVGNKIITLSPGKMLVLTRQMSADFDDINPEKRIAHRNVKTVATTDNVRVYAADFSLPSMMMNVAPIKRMLASDNPNERRQARKMLKNAVVLAQLSGQQGPFSSGHNP